MGSEPDLDDSVFRGGCISGGPTVQDTSLSRAFLNNGFAYQTLASWSAVRVMSIHSNTCTLADKLALFVVVLPQLRSPSTEYAYHQAADAVHYTTLHHSQATTTPLSLAEGHCTGYFQACSVSSPAVRMYHQYRHLSALGYQLVLQACVIFRTSTSTCEKTSFCFFQG